MATSAKEAKQAAAQARAIADAERKNRERKVRIAGAGIVAVVLAVLVAIPLAQSNSNKIKASKVPTGVSTSTYGVKVGPGWTAANASKIPTLDIWEDFQCPVCGDFEKTTGATIKKLAAENKLRLQYRPAGFLDSNLSAQNSAAGNPESSLRATNAFGCAVDQGIGWDFHGLVFQNQPKTEGDGYNDSTFLSIARQLGLTGDKLSSFTDCVDNKTYKGWANNSFVKFSAEGHSGTPTALLNGKELPLAVLSNPAKFTKAVALEAASQK